MTAPTTALKLDTAQIRTWITEASAIALRYFGNVDPQWKGIADPVTAADFEIEQLLRARIGEAYPDHGIIGEEYGSESLDHEFLWAIDPIDGTRMFVEGLPTWSITIALLHELQPVFGLVYMPLLDDWTYTEGEDVICNGRVVTGNLPTRWDADSFIFWRSDGHTIYDLHFTRIMAYGSSACHAAYQARGSNAVATLAHDTYMWDIAALAAFMAKQGGTVAYMSGDPVDFAQLDLRAQIPGTYIAAHPDIVARMISLLHPRTEDVNHPAW